MLIKIDRSQEDSSLAVVAGSVCVLLLPIVFATLICLTAAVAVSLRHTGEDGVTPLGDYVLLRPPEGAVIRAEVEDFEFIPTGGLFPGSPPAVCVIIVSGKHKEACYTYVGSPEETGIMAEAAKSPKAPRPVMYIRPLQAFPPRGGVIGGSEIVSLRRF